MIKTIILLCVALCCLESRASPSVNVIRVPDRCACATQSERLTTPTLASEEFVARTIETAVSAAIAQAASSTPSPASSCTSEEIESFMTPLQNTITRLIDTLDQLSVPTSTITPAPASCTKTDITSVVATLQTLTRTVEQLEASAVTTPAPAPSLTQEDIASAVAPYLLTIQKLNETVNEQNINLSQLNETIRQLKTLNLTPHGCINGYTLSDETNHCYKVHTEEVMWPVANTTCTTEGAQLAIINSHREAQFLNVIRIGYNHIGVYRDSTDNWWTVTGEDVIAAAAGYNGWDGGKPWSATKWRYGGVMINGKIYQATADHECGFICEMAPF